MDTAIAYSTEDNCLKALMTPVMKNYPKMKLTYGGKIQKKSRLTCTYRKAAIIGIAIILLALFKSVRQSLLVLSTIPLYISVIWTFYLHGKPLSFLGMIVSPSRVIVNNAIVLIDFINQLRAEGEDRIPRA